jgi:hypothetical protein
MKIVIDRDRANHQWVANGRAFVADDARDAVKHVQALFPDAQIGVASTVFGRATVAAFGPVVWMQPNLN